MLTKKMTKYFSGKVRSRGNSYAIQHRVEGITIRGNTLEAKVIGSEEYEVAIDRLVDADGWRLVLDCNCPFAFDNGSRCKHIWALLVEAESKISKAWGLPPNRVTITKDPEEMDDPDNDNDADVPYIPRRDLRYAQSGHFDKAAFAKVKAEIFASFTQPQIERKQQKVKKPKVPSWKKLLQETTSHISQSHFNRDTRDASPITSNVWFVIDGAKSRFNDLIIIELMREHRQQSTGDKSSGMPLKLTRLSIRGDDVGRIENPDDRMLCALLVGAARPERESFAYDEYRQDDLRGAHWQLNPKLLQIALPQLARTGRFMWRDNEFDTPVPATFAPDTPWELAIELVPVSVGSEHAAVSPVLRRRAPVEQSVALQEISVAVNGDAGAAIYQGEISPLHIAGGSAGGMLRWARDVANRAPVLVDRTDIAAFMEELSRNKIKLPVTWKEGWGPTQLEGLRPGLRLELSTQQPGQRNYTINGLFARVKFQYEGVWVEADNARYVQAQRADGTPVMVIRNAEAERLAVQRLLDLGCKKDYSGLLEVAIKRIPSLAAELLQEGWEVVRDAATIRSPGKVNISVASGIDWFELSGVTEFGSTSASIGAVLAALRKGEKFVSLDDGSLGLLPEVWLAKHGRWLGLGQEEQDGVRFGRAQISLIDALMAEMPEATGDKQVAAARAKLHAFTGIESRVEPKGFRGELRPYQRQGLGWLHFLAEFGLGGCLADDMGLGKTVQLLAHLADRRGKKNKRPWLVVAPKSLMFNWAKEAERFTPNILVHNHTGVGRATTGEDLMRADLVLTTYATMRLDIELLSGIDFECVVLDEAQAIKNATSQSAKASRLLKASRRLALTGTPVENRLDDLWSIFEFLNPGMLGSSTAFKEASRSGENKEGMEVLRRALRPFLLRRTKATVAPELPSKTELTVRCEMEGKQRTLYSQLRTHYQSQLLGRVERDGMNKSKMHVLAALLRLRQVACHPALIDSTTKNSKGTARKRTTSTGDSAKLATLLEMLNELCNEGHKALVFSQFTSLLALVKTALDQSGIGYEELDGSTSSKEREVRVHRFQSVPVKDGGKGVFLISLKAGGVGLNLTAAGYVFVLDPWWNPAVEAQAIDRTHRIGQDKSVIAYRLIASGTVEERMLELQDKKRELAAAIISENAGPLSSMTREDLALLLS